PGDRAALVADVVPHFFSLLCALALGDLAAISWRALTTPGGLRAIGMLGGTALSLRVSLEARPTECALVVRATGATVHADLFHGYAFREPGTVSRARKLLRPFDLSV